MRLLLVGANGQVGDALRRSLAPLGDVIATTRSGRLDDDAACEALDLADLDAIAFGRGLEVTLEVERTAFHGHSAFLFGSVLARYLSRHVEVNHFVETVLTMAGRGELMRWRPLCGTRPIL